MRLAPRVGKLLHKHSYPHSPEPHICEKPRHPARLRDRGVFFTDGHLLD